MSSFLWTCPGLQICVSTQFFATFIVLDDLTLHGYVTDSVQLALCAPHRLFSYCVLYFGSLLRVTKLGSRSRLLLIAALLCLSAVRGVYSGTITPFDVRF